MKRCVWRFNVKPSLTPSTQPSKHGDALKVTSASTRTFTLDGALEGGGVLAGIEVWIRSDCSIVLWFRIILHLQQQAEKVLSSERWFLICSITDRFALTSTHRTHFNGVVGWVCFRENIFEEFLEERHVSLTVKLEPETKTVSVEGKNKQSGKKNKELKVELNISYLNIKKNSPVLQTAFPPRFEDLRCRSRYLSPCSGSTHL